MIDHLTLRVRDHVASKTFYTAALAPLGYEVILESGVGVGVGVRGKPDFWFHSTETGEADGPLHLAFRARDRDAVHGFHTAALEAGGTDNGGPGLRAHYHPNYYAAFAFDPDGNNIEVVCHDAVE